MAQADEKHFERQQYEAGMRQFTAWRDNIALEDRQTKPKELAFCSALVMLLMRRRWRFVARDTVLIYSGVSLAMGSYGNLNPFF